MRVCRGTIKDLSDLVVVFLLGRTAFKGCICYLINRAKEDEETN